MTTWPRAARSPGRPDGPGQHEHAQRPCRRKPTACMRMAPTRGTSQMPMRKPSSRNRSTSPLARPTWISRKTRVAIDARGRIERLQDHGREDADAVGRDVHEEPGAGRQERQPQEGRPEQRAVAGLEPAGRGRGRGRAASAVLAPGSAAARRAARPRRGRARQASAGSPARSAAERRTGRRSRRWRANSKRQASRLAGLAQQPDAQERGQHHADRLEGDRADDHLLPLGRRAWSRRRRRRPPGSPCRSRRRPGTGRPAPRRPNWRASGPARRPPAAPCRRGTRPCGRAGRKGGRRSRRLQHGTQHQGGAQEGRPRAAPSRTAPAAAARRARS